MDLDPSSYTRASDSGPENLAAHNFFFHSEPQASPEPNAYTKKTILQSPIITKIVPQFTVCTTKPLTGLASSYLSEEKDQTWVPPPAQDSFFGDDMSEDDAILDLGNSTNLDASQDSFLGEKVQHEYAEIELLVKNTSLTVDGVEFPLIASVTACAVVPRSESSNSPEDSLLVALSSGFQLLIRVWKVPRSFSDASFASDPYTPISVAAETTTTSHVYKPFVVQWWRLSGEKSVTPACSALNVHPSGSAVVSAAPDSVFRIHTCEITDFGMQLSPHFNVPINGVLLHSCFAFPFEASGANNQILFMTLTFTNQRRLAISLYSWYASESITGNLDKTTLPLNNSFPFPVMVVPLAENNSFLFVCPDEFIVVTVNNIWSADYSFAKFAYDGSFPTSFSTTPSMQQSLQPPSSLSSTADAPVATDEVFLASDSGVVYSVIITNNTELTCCPILRVADPISTFTLNHSADGNGFILTYASDTAGAKALYFTSLMAPVLRNEKIPFTEATLLKDYKNWAPVVDVSVIDAPPSRNLISESAQELWALTGIGKRTKLSHLRSGYVVKRESRNFDEFRKADSLTLVSSRNKQYFICSMSFETKMWEYVPEIEEIDSDDHEHEEEEEAEVPDPIIEVSNAEIFSGNSTLCFQFLPDSETAFQFTRQTITATNLNYSKTSNLGDSEILFAEMVGDIAVLAVQKSGGVTIEIIRVSGILDFTSQENLISNEAYFRILSSIPTDIQISMMKCFEKNGLIYIICGTFSESLTLLSFNPTTGEHAVLFSIDLKEYLKSFPTESFLIPHDAVISPEFSKLYMGTKCGHFLEFDFDENLSPKISQVFTLGTTPIKLVLSKNDPHFLFACMRNVWLFNFYTSKTPMRVSFDEKIDKAVSSIIELPTLEPQHLRFGFLREDGLVIGSVFCHEKPILRQLGIGEPAKRLLFLDTSNLFVILCKSKGQQSRLKFAERKSFKMLPVMEIDSKTGSNRSDWIFASSEIPTCAMVWHINRNDRVSKKVIVGTSVDGNTGNLKILDISKVVVEGSRIPTVKVVELWSISRDKPVTSIQQIDSTVFFAAGSCVYSTSYSLENKKFRPVVKLTTLASDITNLGVAGDDTLLVNTQLDSLLAYKFTETREEETLVENAENSSSSSELKITFKDLIPRCLVNAAAVGKKFAAGDKLLSTLRVFDPESPLPENCFSYTLSMVPRVYNTRLRAHWSEDNAHENQICCVAVNGQVVSLNPVDDEGDEITNLKQKLAFEHKIPEPSALGVVMERLDRPFLEKVTGKGFQSIYKPFFDYDENRDKLIDYDVEELSKVSCSSVLL